MKIVECSNKAKDKPRVIHTLSGGHRATVRSCQWDPKVKLFLLAYLFFEEKKLEYCDTPGIVVTKLEPYLITQKTLNIFK